MRIKHPLLLYSSDIQPLSSVESLRSLLENVKKNSQGGLQIIVCGMTKLIRVQASKMAVRDAGGHTDMVLFVESRQGSAGSIPCEPGSQDQCEGRRQQYRAFQSTSLF